MYEIDGIYYAGKAESNIKVSAAKMLRGGMMLITFSTGEKRIFDASKMEGSAFEPLKDKRLLEDFTIFHGVVTWMNGEIDIAPETMYAESYSYDAVG